MSAPTPPPPQVPAPEKKLGIKHTRVSLIRESVVFGIGMLYAVAALGIWGRGRPTVARILAGLAIFFLVVDVSSLAKGRSSVFVVTLLFGVSAIVANVKSVPWAIGLSVVFVLVYNPWSWGIATRAVRKKASGPR